MLHLVGILFPHVEKSLSEKLVAKILELLWNTQFYYLPFLQHAAAELYSESIEFYQHSHALHF